MSEADFYPAGAYRDPSAPYNQSDIPEEEFEVTCSQSLSRTATVWTSNYIPGASGVDYERDDEGGTYASSWHDDPDTSDTNWAEEYHDNDHYTPIQLIGLYKETLKEQLKSWEGMDEIPSAKAQIRRIEHLIEECEGWTEDETEYVEN
jgi:hypothetical protein